MFCNENDSFLLSQCPHHITCEIFFYNVFQQERLLQFVSLSASGLAMELKQPESIARESLTKAVFSIAEQDPEFILKVKKSVSFQN